MCLLKTTAFQKQLLDVYKRQDTNWAIEGMENADLTQISIDQAIACLQNLEYTQIIENGMDKAADYGLDKGVTDEAYDESGLSLIHI